MDFKKFGNFNWIEMGSKDQNLDLTRTKRINFCPFRSICWDVRTYVHPMHEREIRIRGTYAIITYGKYARFNSIENRPFADRQLLFEDGGF